jgi:starch synthase
MRIVLASSEAVPFSKTGGLADVATGLSRALAAGHEVTLIVPFHRRQAPPSVSCPSTGSTVTVRVGDRDVRGTILRAQLPGSSLRVLLVDQPAYFDRGSLYTAGQTDYADNCERFVFFSRAVLETVRVLDLRPDIVHANDWQTGLVPALVDIEYRGRPGFEHTASVFTVHNMAFQGRFWKWDLRLTGLDWKYFNWRQMEFYGDLNLLKTGIAFADMVTTVSPTYAREICTAEYGYGLNDVLAHRGTDLVGILNGVDTGEWDPATDPHIAARYAVDNWTAGKSLCKRQLQEQCGLALRGDVPLFGMISRMTDQKGFDLIAAKADDILQGDVQMVFLGTGEKRYEDLVRTLAGRYPGKAAAVIGFDERLAHRIEAGADIYLMPSRFEPCGLNQQYSLLYGTAPIVHAVGGLADSVVDASGTNLARGVANGFRFERYDAELFAEQVFRAVTLYHDKPTWGRLVCAGMSRDWSWNRGAAEYVDVYRRAMGKHTG